jgi:ferric-chelate reductase
MADRKAELVWAVRRDGDLAWISKELNSLRCASGSHNLKIRIFVTRENERKDVQTVAKQTDTKCGFVDDDRIATSSVSSSSGEYSKDACSCPGSYSVRHPKEVDASPEARHPNLDALVQGFVASTVRGSTTVFASGPGGMVSDLRRIVAGCNAGGRVWKGDQRYDVKLVCDDRLEW